jgi:hypothetical protein
LQSTANFHLITKPLLYSAAYNRTALSLLAVEKKPRKAFFFTFPATSKKNQFKLPREMEKTPK